MCSSRAVATSSIASRSQKHSSWRPGPHGLSLGRVKRRSWILLLVLASLWGASYMFIKVSLEDLSAEALVFGRCALAALVLIPIAVHRGAFAPLRGRIGGLVVLGLIQVAVPFMLISLGERDISSSL